MKENKRSKEWKAAHSKRLQAFWDSKEGRRRKAQISMKLAGRASPLKGRKRSAEAVAKQRATRARNRLGPLHIFEETLARKLVKLGLNRKYDVAELDFDEVMEQAEGLLNEKQVIALIKEARS